MTFFDQHSVDEANRIRMLISELVVVLDRDSRQMSMTLL